MLESDATRGEGQAPLLTAVVPLFHFCACSYLPSMGLNGSIPADGYPLPLTLKYLNLVGLSPYFGEIAD